MLIIPSLPPWSICDGNDQGEHEHQGIKAVPISVQPCPKADLNVSASNRRILTPSNCITLKNKARELMVHFQMEYWRGGGGMLTQFLVDNNLSAQPIVDSFTVCFEE